MKTVVLNESRSTVMVKEVSVDKFYGVKIGKGKGSVYNTGFITRDKFEEGMYRVKAISAITDGNGWAFYDSYSLQEIVEKLLGSNNTVFEFDSEAEFIEFLYANRK